MKWLSHLFIVLPQPRWSPLPTGFEIQAWGYIRGNKEPSIVSFSGPAGSCSIKKVEILVLGMGLCEASRLGFCFILLVGVSLCAH